MKTSQQILSSVLKTTQMGQIGIRSVLDTRMRPGLKDALTSQLKEYDALESEAHTLATQRGWELPELDPAARAMASMMTRVKLQMGGNDSKHQGHDQKPEADAPASPGGQPDLRPVSKAVGYGKRQYPTDAGVFVEFIFHCTSLNVRA